MRHRAEILLDAIRKTDKDVIIPEFADKLSLLELEVLVDIRDNLNMLVTILGSVEKVAYRSG